MEIKEISKNKVNNSSIVLSNFIIERFEKILFNLNLIKLVEEIHPINLKVKDDKKIILTENSYEIVDGDYFIQGDNRYHFILENGYNKKRLLNHLRDSIRLQQSIINRNRTYN